ncbi:MAG: MFS transporter [Saprospiraceae bacterium]|nr:MFS transporter [Saprospiraceae bacterium]MCB9355964.1 MFS transporter [Lewinellaceae bacterium]
MAEKSVFTPYQKTVVALLAITQFTVVLDFMVMAPLGDILIKSMDLSPAQFGLAVSSYAFSAGLSGFMAAGFADKYDRKSLLLFFYTGFIAGTLFCGLAPNYPTLIAARIITGIFGGVIGSISLAIVTDLFDLSLRGRVMGFIQMGFGASQVLGIPIGLYFANLWGWHAPFLMIVGLGLIMAALIFNKLQPVREHLGKDTGRNALQHLRHTFAIADYRYAFSATALLSIGGFLLMPFSSAFLVNNTGITHEQLPLVFMITGVFSLLAMPAVGRLADKVDKFTLFAVGSVWAVIFMIIYTHMTISPMWYVVAINILLFAGIMSRMVPSMAIMTAVPSMPDRGAFMSINSSLQQIAGGIASAFAGVIVVQHTKNSPLEHYDTLGFIGASIVLLCVVLMWQVNKRSVKKVEKAPQVVALES